ncbi:alpha/beta fold hydrolase [Streptomyces sp. NPDC020917]|uniref:alpha/beta fold hydrolase n=1 Tax=Streptomyces sp. NPDC020917 TaxID=3365102 RepID=UPI003787D972
MPTFSAPDGTRLAYRTAGTGAPLVCVPGGPADSAYLGDLGGLSAHRRLVVLDLRGTGGSAVPEDPASYRCDRLVDDVEALRAHLGLARIDLLGHSGGANLALQYAARHPDRLGRLALVAPGSRAAGITITGEQRRTVARLRADEPWFAAAYAALEAVTEGRDGDWDAISPFFYTRWDAATRAHHAEAQPRNQDAVAAFAAEGAFDPPATRAALSALTAPALLLAGEFDVNSPPTSVAELAALLPGASLSVQPASSHSPWLDDPGRFVATLSRFLS